MQNLNEPPRENGQLEINTEKGTKWDSTENRNTDNIKQELATLLASEKHYDRNKATEKWNHLHSQAVIKTTNKNLYRRIRATGPNLGAGQIRIPSVRQTDLKTLGPSHA